ncbi:FAD/NAD(P)-binding protein [Saccharothrix deserti]|uniref:FAD/NAD(P)-binding protein n=1 Tax=Saccharothrix deserti TaxID=2593674 RepID=UPI00131BDD99|nr:FAD/NAD(P)-binding protein [Saccharothrix deserti]
MSSIDVRSAICVIGAGPRGLSVVERLCANADVTRGRVVVHLIDPYVDSGGRVWRTDQPGELLMNTIASQVTLFTDDSVECVGPIVPGPSLYDWATGLRLVGEFDDYPENVRREARELTPDSYPSRAFYGHYLKWVLRHLEVNAPIGVGIVRHRATAISVEDDEDGTQVVVLDNGQVLSGLVSVVLAQGHVDMPAESGVHRLREFAATHGLRYFAPGNPADADLDTIPPGEAVALRGMGLNFFDYMALLTRGRDGRFTEGPDGELVYHPSGREPRLYAGSRRGVPYHSRGENQKGASGRHEPLFLTPAVIAELRAHADDGRAPEFRRDVWPLVSREVRAVYYCTLLAERGRTASAARFLRKFTADLSPAAEDDLLDRFGIPPALRWDWETIARPYGSRVFTGPDDFRDWLVEHLRDDVAQAVLGNVRGPLKAALDVLRDLRNEVRLVVDHSGISGRSYRAELQEWYTPLNAFLSIGPPVSRAREMIALIRHGVLTVLGPGTRIEPDPLGTGFVALATGVPGSVVRVGTLIEARLPEVDVRRTTDPVIRGLRRGGRCAPYRIPDRMDGDYETGGLAVTRRPYHVLDADRRPHPRRFAFGVPTEAVHWVTAAGVRPGVNSVILADADAIARACLALGRPAVPYRRLYLTRHIPLAWLPTSCAPVPTARRTR